MTDEPTDEPRAVTRLRLAARQARDAGDPEAFVVAAGALHAALRRAEPDSHGRAQLRRELLDAGEQVRGGFRSRAGRLRAVTLLDELTGALMLDVLDDEHPDPSALLDLAEAGRARVLLDILAGRLHGEAPGRAELEAQALGFEHDPDESAERAEWRLLSAVRPLAGFPDDRDRAGAVAALESLHAGTGFVGQASPATLPQVQALLADDEVLAEYVVPYVPLHPAAALAAVVVTRTRAEVVGLDIPTDGSFVGAMAVDGMAPVDASPLGWLVQEARLAVQGADDEGARRAAAGLYDLLIAPLLPATGTATSSSVAPSSASDAFTSDAPRHWIVVPHRQLHPVPWTGLLTPDGQPWLRHAAVSVAPSASVWSHLREHPAEGTAALALGDAPLAYAGLGRLPGAADEVDHLARTWRAAGRTVDARTGPAATAAALVSGSSSARVVHLATHGSTPRPDRPDRQEILLAWSPGVPGRLDVERLRGLDLHAAWCLTFSVCDGGLYLVGPGDEPLGLVAAGLEAGATTVIAARWAVDDAATRRLMAVLVDHLVEQGPAPALRTAALALAESGAPLRDWSSFTCLGSGHGV